MPLIEVGNRTVNYMEVGSGEPLVLLHGLGTSLASMWLSLARPLSRTRRLLLYDHRGHGRSETTDRGYDVDTLADDLRALLDRLDRREAMDMAGYSYGGAALVRFLIDHPDRIRRAVLLDVPMPPYGTEDFLALSRPFDVPDHEVMGLFGDDAEAFTAAAGRLLSEFGSRAKTTRRTRDARWTSPEGARFATALKADIETVPAFDPDALAGIEAPVLVLSCARSAYRAEHERLVATIPNARLEILDGGHFAPLLRPAPFAAAMEAFLDA